MAFIVTPAQLNRRAELYHQLGSMISAGVPLPRAMEMVSASPAISASGKDFSGLLQGLRSGLSFSESLARVPGWMPEFDVALLGIGEASGRLDASFRLLSGYYALRASIIRDTLAGSLVTLATLHVFLLVFPLRLLTAFAQGILFNNYSLCIPFLVEKCVVFGALYAAVLLLIYACQGRHGESWRGIVESVFRLIPILRSAQRYLVLSRLAGALEALTSAGVSVVRGWELAGAAAASPRLRREISGWREEFENGATPGELINRSSYFPEMFANLYNTAEQSGKVEEALHRLQAYYQEEGFRKLRAFTRVMNGTIYALVVLLVAYNIISFYLGYYGAMFRGI
jgi:type II secretory pathway component PulF